MKTPKDNTPLQTAPAAWIGLDWGDKEHAFAIQDTAGKSEEGTLTHSAENLHNWLQGLRERYGARPVALAIEAKGLLPTHDQEWQEARNDPPRLGLQVDPRAVEMLARSQTLR